MALPQTKPPESRTPAGNEPPDPASKVECERYARDLYVRQGLSIDEVYEECARLGLSQTSLSTIRRRYKRDDWKAQRREWERKLNAERDAVDAESEAERASRHARVVLIGQKLATRIHGQVIRTLNVLTGPDKAGQEKPPLMPNTLAAIALANWRASVTVERSVKMERDIKGPGADPMSPIFEVAQQLYLEEQAKRDQARAAALDQADMADARRQAREDEARRKRTTKPEQPPVVRRRAPDVPPPKPRSDRVEKDPTEGYDET